MYIYADSMGTQCSLTKVLTNIPNLFLINQSNERQQQQRKTNQQVEQGRRHCMRETTWNSLILYFGGVETFVIRKRGLRGAG